MKKQVVVLASLALASAAFATDFMWKAAVDGAFGTAANWSPDTGVPGEEDKAIFSVPGSYCVCESDASRTIGSVNVTNADVTVDLGGKTWTVKGPWSTYNSVYNTTMTHTTIMNGTLDVQDGNSSDASGIIVSTKDNVATKGNLHITGANTRVTTRALWMGATQGSFILDGGATCEVAGEVRWGGKMGGGHDNVVSITGAGTRFRQTASGDATGNGIGDRNKYYFTDQASVYFASMYYLAGDYGGRWNQLWITNGASVVYGNGFTVSKGDNSRSVQQDVCTIAGADTRVTVTGTLWVAGNSISNTLHVTDHAIVTHALASGSTVCTIGRDGTRVGLACGNEFRVDGGAEYHCIPNPAQNYNYHSLYVGDGAYSTGNRIFVGADSIFELARNNNEGFVGYNGAHDNGIVVSNGTFNVTKDWNLSFGTSKNNDTPCGSGNYIEFYGDHPLAYVGVLKFHTGSKLVYHVDEKGYGTSPLMIRYFVTNESETPSQLVLDVSRWHPDGKATIPLAYSMQTSAERIQKNKVWFDELREHVIITGAAHPDWYSVAVSEDDKTLQLIYKPRKGLEIIIR